MALTRLEVYINSHGKIVPWDYTDYQHGSNCVFCTLDIRQEELKGGEYSNLFVWERSNRRRLSAKVCLACTQQINAAGILDVDASVVGPFHWGRTERIENLGSLRLSNDVGDYYTYRVDNDRHDHCYGCDTPITKRMGDFHLLEIPIDYDTRLTGGHIMLCKTCDTAYYEMFASKFDVRNFPHADVKCSCANCEAPYHITAAEHTFRETESYKDYKYLCPKCVYQQLITMIGKLEIDNFNFERFIVMSCKTCQYPTNRDMTVMAGSQDYRYCKPCVYKNQIPIAAIKRKKFILLIYPSTLVGSDYIIRIVGESQEMGIRATGTISSANYLNGMANAIEVLNFYEKP